MRIYISREITRESRGFISRARSRVEAEDPEARVTTRGEDPDERRGSLAGDHPEESVKETG